MVSALHFICLIITLSFTNAWIFPSAFNNVQDRNSSNSWSIFDEISKKMADMHQSFDKLFSLSFSADSHFESADLSKVFEGIQANCTNTTTTPLRSLVRNRRKILRNTTTINCIKEVMINGTQYVYKESNVTDENGNLVGRSTGYQQYYMKPQNLTSMIIGDQKQWTN